MRVHACACVRVCMCACVHRAEGDGTEKGRRLARLDHHLPPRKALERQCVIGQQQLQLGL